MKMNWITFFGAGIIANTAVADAPKVVTDIAPIQLLVTSVMDGRGQSTMLLKPGENPHSATLRPSQARALQAADLVFWVGEDLTPWLEQPIETLATNARSVELMHSPNSIVLDNKEFDDEHDEHDEQKEHEGHDEHDHGQHDPHAWLDPENAKIWLDIIANGLAEVDPENAEQYAANALAAKANISVAMADISNLLKDAQSNNYIIFHDAMQYYEKRFSLNFIGAVVDTDDQPTSAARLSAITQQLVEQDIVCMFTDRGAQTKFVETLINSREIGHANLDLFGSPKGKNGYSEMLKGLAVSIATCADD